MQKSARIKPLSLAAAVIAVLLLLGTVLLIRDGFGIRTRLAALFIHTDGDGEGREGTSGGLQSMTRERTEPQRVFFEITEENALDSLVPAPCYTRVMRVSYRWDDRRADTRWTLSVDGNCWRLSSPQDEIFCDGEYIYAWIAGYASVTEGTAWEPEIGAASLSELLSRREDGWTVDVTLNGSAVEVRTEEEGGREDTFVVDVEGGIIVTESCRFNGSLIRTITTDELRVREETPSSEQYRDMADAFFEAHPEAVKPEGYDWDE